jgi:hypothetical protein
MRDVRVQLIVVVLALASLPVLDWAVQAVQAESATAAPPAVLSAYEVNQEEVPGGWLFVVTTPQGGIATSYIPEVPQRPERNFYGERWED